MFWSVVEEMERTLVGFEPAGLPVASVESSLLALDRIERLAAGTKVRLAGRLDETGGWQRAGRRSAADHLALLSSSTVGAALGVLATSKRLADLPIVVAALADGRLSATQVQAVADAAAAAPHEQASLVAAAGEESVSELRERCGRVKAAADKDPEATHRRLHAARSLRQRTCPDGAAQVTYRSTSNEVAEVMSVVRAFADPLFKAAPKAGVPESSEAHLADGLLAPVRQGGVLRRIAEQPDGDSAAPNGAATAEPNRSAGPDRSHSGSAGPDLFGPPAPDAAACAPDQKAAAGGDPLVGVVPKLVVFRIDWDAWIRGWTIDGEVCEIPGLGPVPVSLIRAMVESGDAVLKAVVTRGANVVTTAHVGRQANVAQRTALQWQDLVCVETGCGQRAYLEIDHTVPYETSRVTALAFLAPRCKHHHRIKTRRDLIDIAANRERAGP